MKYPEVWQHVFTISINGKSNVDTIGNPTVIFCFPKKMSLKMRKNIVAWWRHLVWYNLVILSSGDCLLPVWRLVITLNNVDVFRTVPTCSNKLEIWNLKEKYFLRFVCMSVIQRMVCRLLPEPLPEPILTYFWWDHREQTSNLKCNLRQKVKFRQIKRMWKWCCLQNIFRPFVDVWICRKESNNIA